MKDVLRFRRRLQPRDESCRVQELISFDAALRRPQFRICFLYTRADAAQFGQLPVLRTRSDTSSGHRNALRAATKRAHRMPCLGSALIKAPPHFVFDSTLEISFPLRRSCGWTMVSARQCDLFPRRFESNVMPKRRRNFVSDPKSQELERSTGEERRE